MMVLKLVVHKKRRQVLAALLLVSLSCFAFFSKSPSADVKDKIHNEPKLLSSLSPLISTSDPNKLQKYPILEEIKHRKLLELLDSSLERPDSKFDFDSKRNYNYRSLLDSYGDEFVDDPVAEKCMLYFDQLYLINEGWAVKPHKYSSDEDEVNQMTNEMKHLNVYASCFLNNSDNNLELSLNSFDQLVTKAGYRDLDTRVFPYLSRKMPIFVRWTGEQTIGPPEISKFLQNNKKEISLTDIDTSKLIPTEPITVEQEVPLNVPFFSKYKSMVNGKGIVLSCADRYLNDTLSLIRSLRALGTKLPLQLIHRGDLSPESQWQIISECRKTDNILPEFEYNKLKQIHHSDFDPEYPKIEVWFANVSRSLSEEFKDEFDLYYNKLLAYIFNSFDEVLLIDCDVVIFRNPEMFFQSSQYKKSGSLFFKDRNLDPKVSDGFIDFLETLIPTDIDTTFFNIPETTYRTLGSRYFTLKYGHRMEAGVVAIRRSDFWLGMFSAIQLSLLRPVRENAWGDKELFWLGQSIAANENYEFNDYWSASVGKLTPPDRRTDYLSQELCSTHPGHISSDDDRLMWVNSGMITCRRQEMYDRDFDNLLRLGFDTKEELRDYYNSILEIRDAIIPPDSLYLVDNFKTPREPNQGFVKAYHCDSYLWCAYDKIGGSEFPEHQGQVIKFSSDDALLYDYIGKVYVGDLSSLTAENTDEQEN